MNNPATQQVLNFSEPTKEMLKRDGEFPVSAVVAVNPAHSDIVLNALNQLNTALMMHMPAEKIELILQDEVLLTTGKVLTLQKNSLFFSVNYPTAPGRIFEMELGTPEGATVH